MMQRSTAEALCCKILARLLFLWLPALGGPTLASTPHLTGEETEVQQAQREAHPPSQPGARSFWAQAAPRASHTAPYKKGNFWMHCLSSRLLFTHQKVLEVKLMILISGVRCEKQTWVSVTSGGHT